jgi:hypothetical protein
VVTQLVLDGVAWLPTGAQSSSDCTLRLVSMLVCVMDWHYCYCLYVTMDVRGDAELGVVL